MAPLKPPPTMTTVLAATVRAGFLLAVKRCLHIRLPTQEPDGTRLPALALWRREAFAMRTSSTLPSAQIVSPWSVAP